MYKKIISSTLLLLLISVNGANAYVLNDRENTIVDRAYTRIESVIAKKGESVRESVVAQLNKLRNEKFANNEGMNAIIRTTAERIEANTKAPTITEKTSVSETGSSISSQSLVKSLLSDGIKTLSKLNVEDMKDALADNKYYRAAPSIYAKLEADFSSVCLQSSGTVDTITCPLADAKTWMKFVYLHTLTIEKYSIEPMEQIFATSALPDIEYVLNGLEKENIDSRSIRYGAYDQDLIFNIWNVTPTWDMSNGSTNHEKITFQLDPDKGKHLELFVKRKLGIITKAPYEFTIQGHGPYSRYSPGPSTGIQPSTGNYYPVPEHAHRAPRKDTVWTCDEGYYHKPITMKASGLCLPDDTPITNDAKELYKPMPTTIDPKYMMKSMGDGSTDFPIGGYGSIPESGPMQYKKLDCINLFGCPGNEGVRQETARQNEYKYQEMIRKALSGQH